MTPQVAAVQPLLAHPLTEPGRLEIPPLAAAVVAMLIVASVARFWPGPRRTERAAPTPAFEVHSWFGGLSPFRVAGRLVAIAALLLAVVAGRVGTESEVQNIAPALILGAGLPLLLAASLLFGSVWRWLDPWDGVVRALDRGDGGQPSTEVWWAVAPAALFAWYVGAYRDAYSPRSIGLALGLYSVATVAGCLVLGRQRWLSRAEVFGLLLSWTAIIRRGLAARWTPPAGSEVVLGVVAGGLVFGAIAQSSLWGSLAVGPAALAYGTVGVVVFAGGFATLLWWLERRGGAGAGGVSAASVPAIVGLAVGLAMYADRLFTSVSFLPTLIGDPLGLGSEPFRVRLRFALCPEEVLSCAPLVVVQAGVVLAGSIVGAIVLARRVASPADRQSGMAALSLIVAGGIVAITAS
jgi:hypothetical protein